MEFKMTQTHDPKEGSSKAPNLRVYAGGIEDLTKPYIFGNVARMLLEGGPWDPDTSPNPGPWTKRDLQHDCPENEKNEPADYKMTRIPLRGYEVDDRWWDIPSKSLSNIAYTGTIIRYCLIAGWTPDQIIDALENPNHKGGEYWRWRRARGQNRSDENQQGEESLMSWFHETAMKHTTLDQHKNWRIIANLEPRTVSPGDPLGWIDPNLKVYQIGPNGVPVKPIKAYAVEELPWYGEKVKKWGRRFHVSQAVLDAVKAPTVESPGKPKRDTSGPQWTNPKGKSYEIDLKKVRAVLKWLRSHPATSIVGMKAGSGYNGPAVKFLLGEGLVTETVKPREKGSKGGKPPKVYSAVPKTREQIWEWELTHWDPEKVGPAPAATKMVAGVELVTAGVTQERQAYLEETLYWSEDIAEGLDLDEYLYWCDVV